MPATMEEYLARLTPHLPQQQARPQLPQPQSAVNPLELLVAQQLMSALRPQPSVTPSVKNKPWVSPQMIQGAAQTNVAEQRLAQDNRQLDQSQTNAVVQSQAAQQRVAMDRARLQNELNQPTPEEQAKLDLVGKLLASELAVDRQQAIEGTRFEKDKEMAEFKNQLPPTEKDQALMDYYKALAGRASQESGGGAGAGMDPYKVTALVNAGVISPEQGNKILTQGGVVAEPSLGEWAVNAGMAQQKQRAEAAKTNAEIEKNTGGGGMSEATARMYLNAELRQPGSVDSSILEAAKKRVGAPTISADSLPQGAVIDWDKL